MSCDGLPPALSEEQKIWLSLAVSIRVIRWNVIKSGWLSLRRRRHVHAGTAGIHTCGSLLASYWYKPLTVYLTPQNIDITSTDGKDLAQEKDLILLCGQLRRNEMSVRCWRDCDRIMFQYQIMCWQEGNFPAMVAVDVILARKSTRGSYEWWTGFHGIIWRYLLEYLRGRLLADGEKFLPSHVQRIIKSRWN